MQSEQGFKQGLQEVEVEGVGTVGLGLRRVVVDLEENAVDAGGDGSAGKQGDELRLAARDAVGGRRASGRSGCRQRRRGQGGA